MHLPRLLSLSAFAGIALLLLASFSTQAEGERQLALIELPLPPLKKAETPPVQTATATPEAPADKTPSAEQPTAVQVKARKGDVLENVLKRAGLDLNTIYALARTDQRKLLTRFRPGDTFEVHQNAAGEPIRVIRHLNRTTRIVAERIDDHWKIRKTKLPVEVHTASATGTISDSLYLSGKRAGLSDKIIMNLADLYQWEIDFARQLRPGDTFKVLYEKRYLNGEYIGDGRILAAEVNTSGKTYRAFLLTDKQDKTIGYYDEKGHNLRKAFMRNPVDYVRITSRFTRKRWHPIQHRWKAHRGVDYGGKTGTPVHVTGNGKVIFKGWKRGYGRVVFVKHAGKYTTVYAHLSRFGRIKRGGYVKQGQIIGYIGSSGWATGPHLHYEFRINGRFVDPLKVRFPDASPVPKAYRAVFKQRAQHLLAVLKRLDSDTQLAANFE